MTIDEEIAQAATECDDRFDRLQPRMIAVLRAHGVTEAEMPEALAEAHALYWHESRALLGRLRATLQRLAQLEGRP